MAIKCCVAVFSFVVLVFFQALDAAPAFKFKKSFSTIKNPRTERRLSGAPSAIHYIQPFMSQPINGFTNFFAHSLPMGNPSSSSVYKLPIRFISNGKPNSVYQGYSKTNNYIDYLPQAVSKVIRLPLKYISNAKPIGVYFQDPSFNFI